MSQLDQAIDTIERHIDKQLNFGVPLSGSARQILGRPFGAKGVPDILFADQVLYMFPGGPKFRWGCIAKVLSGRDDIAIKLDESMFTLVGDEEQKEAADGVDSVIALAISFRGVKAWCSIPSYHTYQTIRNETVVARQMGEKILGPSMIIAARPSPVPVPHTAAKHFPNTVDGVFEWLPVGETPLSGIEALTGIDLDRLKDKKAS